MTDGERVAIKSVQSERVNKPRIRITEDGPMSVRTNIKLRPDALRPIVSNKSSTPARRTIPRGEQANDPKSPGRVASIDDISDNVKSPVRRIITPRPEYKINGQNIDVKEIPKIKSPAVVPQSALRVRDNVEGADPGYTPPPVLLQQSMQEFKAQYSDRPPQVMVDQAQYPQYGNPAQIAYDPNINYVPYPPQVPYTAYLPQNPYAAYPPYPAQVPMNQGETSTVPPPAATNSSAPAVDAGSETISREELVNEYLFRFKMIKRRYPHMEINTYDQNSDPDVMKKDYDRILNQIRVEETASGYKLYLVVFVMLVELFYVKVLKFEKAKGFTKSQVMVLSNYQKLLLELGEKDYTGFGAGWPVEVRIAGLVGINSLCFILGNHIFENAGGEIFTTLMSAVRAPGPSIESPAAASDGGGGLAGMLGGLMGMLNGGGGGLGNILNGLGGNNAANSTAESLDKDGTMKPPPERKKRRRNAKKDD
jgi:hypothetical protein